MKLHTSAAMSVVITLAIGLASCSSDHQMTAPTGASTPVAAGAAAAALNAADVEFAQGMIAHHEQAIEMAEIALDPNIGAGTAVIDLATRIKGAQGPEVELMTGWLTAAGKPVAMSTEEGHDMDSMEGMMTADQMDALAGMNGTDFDKRWLDMMIAHHEGAVSQSQTVKANGANIDVIELADQIISAQQLEITEMQTLLKG